MTTEQKTGGPSAEDRVRRSVGRLQNLPALSGVVSKVIALAENPTVSGQQVAEVVGQDQAMVTAILKIVNSPFYGLNRRVSSITHAVILLGYRTVRNIALSTSLVNAFSGPGQDPRFNRRKFWAHSIFTASAARLVAGRLRNVDAEEAFLAGLIHDMGRIVIDQYFSKEFSMALDVAEKKSVPLHLAEKAVLGLDHAEVGRLIAQKWNFPDQVTEAVAVHHDAEGAVRTSELAISIYIGNILSHVAEWRAEQEQEERDDEPVSPVFAVEPKLEDIDASVLEHSGLNAESLEELVCEIEGEMEKAQAFLSSLSM